jgi:hypothetical protein
VTAPEGSELAVAAAARDVAEAAAAFSRLQQITLRGTDPVNRPIEKANYLFAHERLRNARRRHARALGVSRSGASPRSPRLAEIVSESVEVRAKDMRAAK